MPIIPACKWAQRKERVYLTVDVPQPENVKVEFGDKTVTFSGKRGPEGEEFAHTFNLFAEIVTEVF